MKIPSRSQVKRGIQRIEFSPLISNKTGMKKKRFNDINISAAIATEFIDWLVDSGSTYDLIGEDYISELDKRHITCTAKSVSLNTANGPKKCNKVIRMHVGRDREKISPLVLPNCPPVWSMGRRCMRHGWGYYWDPYTIPIMTKPDMSVLKLHLKGECPYRREETWIKGRKAMVCVEQARTAMFAAKNRAKRKCSTSYPSGH